VGVGRQAVHQSGLHLRVSTALGLLSEVSRALGACSSRAGVAQGAKAEHRSLECRLLLLEGGRAGRQAGGEGYPPVSPACLPSFLHARSGQGQARQTEAGRKERREEGRGERRGLRRPSPVSRGGQWR
jgi:hypothetical protein